MSNHKRELRKLGGHPMPDRKEPLQEPIAQTCPECGGARREERVRGKLTQFRCHIGHVMTAEIASASQRERLEHQLSASLRLLNERRQLCRKMAENCRETGNS